MTRTITVRYFASIREAMGTGAETLTTSAATVAALHQELARRSTQAAQALCGTQPVRLALNQNMCPPDAPLATGDEVAFFPPVTGG
jgi:molybdopterin synthase sulfur carrier subunit